MTKVNWLSCFFFLIVLVSCTKEDSLKTSAGYVKSIQAVPDVSVVAGIQMEDGNALIITRNRNRMVKINSRGDVLWDKPLSSQSVTVWDVMRTGTGYATLGGSAYNDIYVIICLYDSDGNILSVKKLDFGNIMNYARPFRFIHLANGHYAIAGSEWYYGNGRLFITDPDFNLLYSKTVTSPAGYTGLEIRGLAETSDGRISMIASTSYSCFLCDTLSTNIVLIRTEANGDTLTKTLVQDFEHNEMANDISTYNDGVVSVSGRMTGWGDSIGVFTSYYGTQAVSGEIMLTVFNSSGQVDGRKVIGNYPGHGVVNTITPTSDGGYILCGTVNTFNSPYVVSKTKVYACKLNAGLDIEWSTIVNTAYPAIGVDAEPASDGGFMVFGSHNLLDDPNQIFVVKTDGNGKY